jgi:hypothetical protein
MVARCHHRRRLLARCRKARQIGEINDTEKQTGKQAKGARAQKLRAGPSRGKKEKTGGVADTLPVFEQSLADRGVDKHLADRARRRRARERREQSVRGLRGVLKTPRSVASLDDRGVDKNLADRARKMWAL